MHELGIMESAMAAVLREAQTRGAQRVHRIVLRIGSLSGVEPDALRFAFDVVARDTLAAAATLDIETVAARSHCPTCQADFDVETGFIFTCPSCGQLCGEVRQGRELELSHLEMS